MEQRAFPATRGACRLLAQTRPCHVRNSFKEPPHVNIEVVQNIEDNDEDDKDSDEDDDDYDDDLTARDQIFPVLVNELNKENIITETDRGVLLNLFASNNSVLNSALDAYDVDNNLGQLVDTLRQVASRYCNNRG